MRPATRLPASCCATRAASARLSSVPARATTFASKAGALAGHHFATTLGDEEYHELDPVDEFGALLDSVVFALTGSKLTQGPTKAGMGQCAGMTREKDVAAVFLVAPNLDGGRA